jgi:hypothetical protein
MIPNGFLAAGVVWVIARYFDRPAIGKEMEVMSRSLVTKTHALIAAHIDARKMILMSRRGLLGHRA